MIYDHINVLEISDLNNELLFDKKPPILKNEISKSLSDTHETLKYKNEPVFSLDYHMNNKRFIFNKYYTILILSKELDNLMFFV